MLVAMTAMLVSVAELSNVVSVVAILAIFCGMVMFILRNMPMFWLHGEEFMFGSSVHPVQQHIPQMKMMKVHIPFTFKLQESPTTSFEAAQQLISESRPPKSVDAKCHGLMPLPSSYVLRGGFVRHVPHRPAISAWVDLYEMFSWAEMKKSEVSCRISSQVCYRLLAYWGVSIRELHMSLWKPWSAINAAIQQGTLLLGHHQQLGTQITEGCHGERIISMRLPSDPVDLGTPPRLCYPLVIFLVRDTPGILHPDETVALINVVHIKDEVCTLPTSILAQYLKQANGQLSCLKQLYLATGNPASYEPGIDFIEGVEQLCVVCQYYPLSRALLPCRHTCICASCFGKLDTCPLCRSPIKSYFCIRSEEYLPDCDKPGSPPSKAEPITQWLQDRLTDFLGFHR